MGKRKACTYCHGTGDLLLPINQFGMHTGRTIPATDANIILYQGHRHVMEACSACGGKGVVNHTAEEKTTTVRLSIGQLNTLLFALSKVECQDRRSRLELQKLAQYIQLHKNSFPHEG